MFKGCSSLTELNLSNFKINKVTKFSSMFEGCESLNKLEIYNFNINKIDEARCSDNVKKLIMAQIKK